MGRYDTSLYLKAQVDNLTGHNEELRLELKESRFEATKANVEFEKAKTKVNNSNYLSGFPASGKIMETCKMKKKNHGFLSVI